MLDSLFLHDPLHTESVDDVATEETSGTEDGSGMALRESVLGPALRGDWSSANLRERTCVVVSILVAIIEQSTRLTFHQQFE